MIIEKEFDNPDSYLARAVLQNNLNKSIVNLKNVIESGNTKNTEISIVLATLTMVMATIAVIQLFGLEFDSKSFKIWSLGILLVSSFMMVKIMIPILIKSMRKLFKKNK